MISLQTSQHPSLRRKFLLLCLVTVIAPLFGDPTVSLETVVEESVITATITGTEFPAITAMTISCPYDPTILNLPDAIIYSPLSSTSIGALLKTVPDTSLFITVTATSSISPENGTPLVTLEIPILSTGASVQGISVAEVKYTNTNGDTRTATINSTPIYHIRPPHTRIRFSNGNRNAASVYFLLNGQRTKGTISRITGNRFMLGKTIDNHRTVRIVNLR